MQRNPELPVRILGERILRAEIPDPARHTNREKRRESGRHNAKAVGTVGIEAGKATPGGVVERLEISEPRYSGAGEAELRMLAADRIRRVAVMQRERRNGNRQAVGRRMERVQCGSARRVDVVFDNVDLFDGRKAAQLASRGIQHDGWRGKRVIEQALVRPAWLDPPVSREREIAEAGITAIDRDRLGEFAGEIGRGDVQRPACHSKHHLLPSEWRQPPAKCL